MLKTKGYHGCSSENANKIIRNGFKRSEGDDHWVGDGIYYFVEGIGDPMVHAQNWAIDNAYDKILKKNTYSRFAVIESMIVVEDKFFLDLTTADGMELFDYYRQKLIEKLKEEKKDFFDDVHLDGKIINFARKEIFRIDVTKGNFYIKFSLARKNKINSRIPNCTLCCAYDPVKNIERNSSKIIYKGYINN